MNAIDSIKQGVMDNIEHEAILFVKHGVPMNVRGPQWAEYTAQCLADAKTKYKYVGPLRKGKLTREQRLERRQRKLALNKNISFEKWLKIAKCLYRKDGYNVISIARGPEHERVFECGSDIEADEKICQLMEYKDYDHFERGCDFAYIPEETDAKESK